MPLPITLTPDKKEGTIKKCVINKVTGEVLRTDKTKIDKLVETGSWKFTTKSVWKKGRKF